MNPFQVILTSEAQADLLRLAPTIQQRILDRPQWMGDNATLLRHEALRGEEWRGAFKYRAGDYRILYQLDQSARELIVLKVGHRRDIYR